MYKPVLVTGASSGIGEATAVHLAHKGFKVFASARRLEKLKPLEGLGNRLITAIEMDVSDEGSIASAIERIMSHSGNIYGVVNNAGVAVTGPMEELPIDEWRRQFETNVFGLVAVTKAVLPFMREEGRGRIVNVGSVAGRLAAPFQSAYASSKHAVEGLTDSLRREVEPFGLHVSLIRPGFINTTFGEQEQLGFERYAVEGGPYTRALDAFRAWHAKGHPDGASPHEVAEAIHHALTAARPHSRYTVPSQYLPALALRNIAPSWITDRLFKRTTGLNKVPNPK